MLSDGAVTAPTGLSDPLRPLPSQLEPPLANHASALKRMRQSRKRRLYNRHNRSSMRTQIRKVRMAVAAKDLAAAITELNAAVSVIQKLAGKKILHKRNASRRVARLYKSVNALRAGAAG